MIATTLHSIAVGNLLPAWVKVVCVDINPSTVIKLSDRGSFQTVGLVTDVEPFLRSLGRSSSTRCRAARPPKICRQATGRRRRTGSSGRLKADSGAHFHSARAYELILERAIATKTPSFEEMLMKTKGKPIVYQGTTLVMPDESL